MPKVKGRRYNGSQGQHQLTTKESTGTKQKLTRQERLGLAQLKRDKDRVILTADKGVAMVAMDKEEYVIKVQELSQPAYRSIPRDPTNKIKAQLITKLRKIKKKNNLEEGTY